MGNSKSRKLKVNPIDTKSDDGNHEHIISLKTDPPGPVAEDFKNKEDISASAKHDEDDNASNASTVEVLEYIVAALRSRSSKMSVQEGRIKLYYLPPSPPCRAVMMLAKAIGVDLELILINILKGEHLTPEFIKMNPQHTIPTLDDNGFILWESRAIMQYLVNAYARDDSLYPKDPKERAIVDQKLNFDQGTLYARFLTLYVPALFHGKELKDENKEKMNEALGFLDKMLEGKKFLAGDKLTIAEFTVILTVSNLDIFGYDISSYENIMSWYERTKKALEPYGYEEINETGARLLANMLKK